MDLLCQLKWNQFYKQGNKQIKIPLKSLQVKEITNEDSKTSLLKTFRNENSKSYVERDWN